jgi:putative transposase
MQAMNVSERFACRVTGQHRTTQRHQPAASTPADPDAGLRSWLRDYAKTHPRWGHRRAYHDARGEGWTVNHKKVQRLWRDEGLRVPQRRRRKRVGASTAETVTADAPNRVWAVDFQFDATTDGRPVKIVSIVDEHTRRTGLPSDGPVGHRTRRARLHPTRPALAERLHRILQRPAPRRMSQHQQLLVARPRPGRDQRLETEYNQHRRHSALGYQAPARYATSCTHQ